MELRWVKGEDGKKTLQWSDGFFHGQDSKQIWEDIPCVELPNKEKTTTEQFWTCVSCNATSYWNDKKYKFCFNCGAKRPKPEPKPEEKRKLAEILKWSVIDADEDIDNRKSRWQSAANAVFADLEKRIDEFTKLNGFPSNFVNNAFGDLKTFIRKEWLGEGGA